MDPFLIPQVLTGNYTIDRLRTMGNIEMARGALVNGLDLDAEYANTWLVDEPSTLKATKRFMGPVRFRKDLNVRGTVNGIDFANQV